MGCYAFRFRGKVGMGGTFANQRHQTLAPIPAFPREEGDSQTRSTIVAIPIPPPTHKVANP